ncbi:MAG TPA: cytochrome c [Candidatus Acidoferrales bacterium]
MKVVRVLVLAVAVLGLLAGVGLYWATSTGMTARAKPGAMETSMAQKVRDWSIPKSAREMQNPMTATPENLEEARRHFADHCANCHGNDGRGTAEMGRNMYPPAPDMTLPSTQNRTDGELYYIIENGVRFTGMPAWGPGGLSDHDTWHLVLFIRHLPQISRQELLDMEDHNPRSPSEIREEEKEDQFLNGAAK